MQKSDLIKKLDMLKKPKVLVIGDFAIDEMMYGKTQRISREAPVLILEHSHTNVILGTASNAAHNISVLSPGNVSAMGAFGKDYHAPILIKALKDAKIKTNYMFEDKNRATTVKTRISGICSHSITQQVVRIDRQTTSPLSKEVENKVLSKLEAAVKAHDGVVLSDYHLGFLTPKIVKNVIALCKKHDKIIVADVQKDFEKYAGVSAITPNEPDCEEYLGHEVETDKDLMRGGEKVIKKMGIKNLLLTRGGKGMALFSLEGKGAAPKVTNITTGKVALAIIPAFNKKEVFDVTGAGDTVVGIFTLALCAGFSALEAAITGNLAASIVIRGFGCQTVTLEELKKELEELEQWNF